MARDPVMVRELKALRDELEAIKRQRNGQAADASAGGSAAAPADRPEDPAGQKDLQGQFGDLAKEVTDFVGDAEKNFAAHPAMSVAAALLVGILIGSLLARR